MQKQQTLAAPFTVTGKGLHTGLDITATFNPAPVNTGYTFTRVDIAERPVIEALADNVAATNRGTVVKKGDIQISTIEHAMAALYCAGIDNCSIEVNAPELPILDGSALPFVEAIEKAGIAEQDAKREVFRIMKKYTVEDPENDIKLEIYPDDHFSVTTFVDYPSPVLNNQFAVLNNVSEFKDKIAAARTFVFVREIQPLLAANLIKGGDLDNAVVIYDQKVEQAELDKLASAIGTDAPSADKLGYVQKRPLLWDNEPARHKLLDILGDIALIGKFIQGRVIATRPGHGINNKLARAVRKDLKRTEVQAPVYDPNKAPILDNVGIKAIMPHRYPMQLVDKIIECETNDYVVGIKNVTANEPFFVGHFPEEPVMPGVLQVEAMAQCSGILVLNSVDEPERYSTYFMKIDNVKFRQKVVPGDTLIFRVQFLSPLRRGVAEMKGYAFVGDKIVSEAEFMAQIIKNK
ncbi:MAG: bifunctional UDP-3-O-[3-hydroxymyristoyl] N-acetylglucosamine deacetylase/3-hydroxyacyl-ACP dehydratase [Bacteroidales bacterium]|nr:bifunctional UDP-3-O-[3-hydroxymyristoyl] N-acetylglucosamine deacetylase/3-hydroxyacyl-ACP dehydratase [Candidatus Liminaster caballi]